MEVPWYTVDKIKNLLNSFTFTCTHVFTFTFLIFFLKTHYYTLHTVTQNTGSYVQNVHVRRSKSKYPRYHFLSATAVSDFVQNPKLPFKKAKSACI